MPADPLPRFYIRIDKLDGDARGAGPTVVYVRDSWYCHRDVACFRPKRYTHNTEERWRVLNRATRFTAKLNAAEQYV